MKKFRSLLLGHLILFFCGCSSTASLNPVNLLTKYSWVLTSEMGDELETGKFVADLPTLDFLEGGNLAGFSGCNNFSGEFTLKGPEIFLDAGAITKKTCLGTGETEFISALERVNNFIVGKEKLILLYGTTELMSFVPKKD